MTQFRLFTEWALLLLAAIAFVVLAQQREWTERFDLWLLDQVSAGHASPAEPSIVLVEIDDRSLATYGSWPWNRTTHADLIASLNASDPAAIGVDILFLEEGPEDQDAALAAAMAANGKTILPHTFSGTGTGEGAPLPAYPIEPLARSAAGLGHVAVAQDSDGAVRRFNLSVDGKGEQFPQFATVIASLASGTREGSESAENTPAIVPFHPVDETFQSLSAVEVLQGTAPEGFFENKIVLIGATAQGLGDRYSVPSYAGGLMSGVETQANLLSAIINDDLIVPLADSWSLLFQIVAVLLLFITFWRTSPRTSLIVTGALIVVLCLSSFVTARSAGLWLAVGPALFAIAMAYPLWGWRRLATVSRFLDAEAKRLGEVTEGDKGESEGFDVVAKQVSRLRTLGGIVRRDLQLIQNVLDASPDAMMVLDKQGTIVMTNPAAAALFGNDTVSSDARFNEIIASENLQYDQTKQELAFADGQVFLIARAYIDPSVGSEVVAMRDISRIKMDEQQRRETLEFLSHDMRSPQVAIIGLTSKTGASLDPEDRLNRIEKQARRTLKLTDDFVQIARIAAQGIVREEVELNSVIFEAADRAFALAHRKKISVRTIESEEPMFVELDPSAMARALDNLIGNAIKFSPEKSEVTLSVDVSSSEAFILEVCDHGPGLPAERVADPFARFGANETEAGPSAGLGLAYVKQVVDKHRGNITITTAPGEGTCFRLVIPYS